MSKLVDAIWDKILGKKQEWNANIVKDVHGLVQLVARGELGLVSVPEEEHALSLFAGIMEASGLSEADFRATVEVYKRRIRQAALATQAGERKRQAVAAEEEYRAADLAEGTRRREAMENLQRLEDAMQRAIQSSAKAAGAESDLLASAERTAEEIALCAELAGVNSRIRELQIKLNPHGRRSGPPESSQHWASVQSLPARLAQQTRTELDRAKAGHSKERKAELAQQLKAAENAVAESERQLLAAHREAAAISKNFARLNEAKLLPESFRIARVVPTADERRKQHAHAIGLANPYQGRP